MTNYKNLRQKIDDGHRATDLIRNEVFIDAWQKTEKRLIDRLLDAEPETAEARAAHYTFKAFRNLEDELLNFIAVGKDASVDLELQEKLAEISSPQKSWVTPPTDFSQP